MQRAAIRREVRRRADRHLAAERLEVDYYRIRRRVSYPLPVRSWSELAMPLRGFPPREYPWATWLSWALEERIHCLGWAAEWFGDRAAAAACARDLAALAAWPAYRQYDQPDLSLGHCARTLLAATRWRWPSRRLRARIASAFARMLADGLPVGDRHFARWSGKDEILALADPRPALHNIPIIGTVGLALAARAIGHPSLAALDARLAMLHGALLDWSGRGFTEAAAYDGYTLDFLAQWLQGLPEAERSPITSHPRFLQPFEESCFLSAPGDAMACAELSDVEPVAMPFHATAHARCLTLVDDPRLAWWLSRCAPAALRCEALAELATTRVRPPRRSPPAGALDAHYALVLRSGWEARDLAAAMSCTTCATGHMHHDDGSVVIGTRGRWLIGDPGYQQYLETAERGFTLGAGAHNAPVIDDAAQDAKACRRVAHGRRGGVLRAELDLTPCYPAALGLERVTRTLWLAGRDLVVVADRVVGAKRSVRHHWHGHPEAGWWWDDGAALLAVDGSTLRIRAPGRPLTDGMVDRRRGSRGQLTLTVESDPRAGAHWWVFSLGRRAEAIALVGGRLRVGRRAFALAEPG